MPLLVKRICLLLFAAHILMWFPLWVPSILAEDSFCIYCGMKRSQFGHSWMIITHGDTVEEMCSIHCAAICLALHTDKMITGITVGDYDTHEQIDAESAFWVIGGDKVGVMTARGKWAFTTKAGADRFIEVHGGEHADFKLVIKAAFEDMYRDTMMIRQKRQMARMRNNAAEKK